MGEVGKKGKIIHSMSKTKDEMLFQISKGAWAMPLRTTVMAADLQVPTRPEGVSSKGWLWARQQLRPRVPRGCFEEALCYVRPCSPTLSGTARGAEAGAAVHPHALTKPPGSWCRIPAPRTERWGRTPGLQEELGRSRRLYGRVAERKELIQ